jgi:hypothetical protein
LSRRRRGQCNGGKERRNHDDQRTGDPADRFEALPTS